MTTVNVRTIPFFSSMLLLGVMTLSACSPAKTTDSDQSLSADPPADKAGPQTATRDTTTILALGDSITQGGKKYPCYRQVLIPELRKKGLAFQFIGPHKDAASAHAGYGGRNTKYLLSISKKLYRQYPADIVLIHSGHNSFSRNEPVPGIVRDTRTIIENIHRINPDVTILLAQVIPSGKLPKYSYIPELNRELAALAARLVQRGYRVILVNQADGFDWRTDTLSDQVHPNASGAKKMAAQWFEALLPLLEKDPEIEK